jgi:exosortase/archaeosortase family protein
MGRRGKREIIISLLDFVVTLNLLSLPFYLILHFKLEWRYLKIVEAFLVSKILRIIGLNSFTIENLIVIGDKVYEVSWDSTGWKSLYVFFSLVVSLPVSFRKKIKPLAVCLTLIFIFNLARLVITIYLSYLYPQSFDFLHLGLWRWGSLMFLLLLWFIFLYFQKNNIGEAKNVVGLMYGRRKS